MAVLPLLAALLFLEVSSGLVLNHVVNPVQRQRFYDLFNGTVGLFSPVPHPYLGWVTPAYVRERNELLSHADRNEPNTIYIAAMGGSTTEDGYPAQTEAYVNEQLRNINSSLRVKVFNFGVGGWNSQNSLINYVYAIRHLRPDFAILHHNVNDFFFKEEMLKLSVLYPPLERWSEPAPLLRSRFYMLLRFTYLLGYNRLRYGTDIVRSEEHGFPMDARLSSYLNLKERHVGARDFFRVDFSGEGGGSLDVSRGVLLAETYRSFITYTAADNTTLIMTTMYVNFSKCGDGWPPPDEERAVTGGINSLLRNLSAAYGVPLVDLDREMEQYDYLLQDDCVHWVPEGIRLKGEIVGVKVFDEVLKRYSAAHEN